MFRQYTIAIFRRPVSAKEQENRRKRLYTDRKVGFDWGVSNVIRTQTLESTFNPSTNVPQSADQYHSSRLMDLPTHQTFG